VQTGKRQETKKVKIKIKAPRGSLVAEEVYPGEEKNANGITPERTRVSYSFVVVVRFVSLGVRKKR
jgi:hypothetical protein